MSMNFSEFKKMLGSDPNNQDPEFLSARDSSPEFQQAAAASDDFEAQVKRAVGVSAPHGLLDKLKEISKQEAPSMGSSWKSYALAASVLMAVAVAGLTMRGPGADSTMGEYIAYHYSLDGQQLLSRGEDVLADNVSEILGQLQVSLSQEARDMVGFIKFCPTPAGKGAHLVINTNDGPITVIFMPDTPVTDGELMKFEGMQAQLVRLGEHSAVIIGKETQQIASYHGLVQSSFSSLST
jgi:hypothetical protein